jgi:hypothetical protein
LRGFRGDAAVVETEGVAVYDDDRFGFDERGWTMLETFEVGTFAPRLGETFRIQSTDAEWLEATLIEAAALGEVAEGRRAQFSLVFRGPGDRVLPQQIYRVAHERIGEFELFLVPIGPDREGMRYEAVFG